MSKKQSLQMDYRKQTMAAFKGNVISDPAVVSEYFERLIAPSKRTIAGHEENAYFIMDYLQGEGDELGGKFFSPYSSSRLCFDLYSWLGAPEYYNQGYEIAFEKYLPRLRLPHNNPYPNMDVLIRRGDTLLFIESKFTETTSYPSNGKASENAFGLPLSYSMGLGELSPEEWKTLIRRYYDNEKAAKRFREFILDINEFAKASPADADWFDPKQECTHLFGIFFYLLGLDPAHSAQTDFGGGIRHVLFYNIVYGFDFQKSPMAERFLAKGNGLVQGLLQDGHSDIAFEYDAISVQQFYQTIIASKTPVVFGSKQKTPLSTFLAGEKHYFDLRLGEEPIPKIRNDSFLSMFAL
ncbi:MAG: hypothetical protein BWY98_00053 [Tenericutes bacterium ADurb.BinA155]|nr:MAG: hypothetical protein BWY98_00053 [Tenericutes bacterium ADurb.BinA155]